MDFIPKDKYLEFREDTLEYIRKEYNLDKPGQMKEAVKILQDWVQKQNHFKKKDFSEAYYEKCIIGCKGSVERAKAQLDKYCTLRTLLPQFYGDFNVKRDFGYVFEKFNAVLLPKLTDDHYRVQMVKFHNCTYKPSFYMDLYKSNIIQGEYVKIHDYIKGFVIIFDLSEANLMDITMTANPIELRQIMTIFVEAYGARIKGIHLISSSKLIDSFISLIKQVISAKVAGRIYVHKNIEEIYEFVPKSILPKDYGGEERSLKELQEQWNEVISSEEHMEHIREMNRAGTDEALRLKDQFSEQYAGMPGTFRLLSVD